MEAEGNEKVSNFIKEKINDKLAEKKGLIFEAQMAIFRKKW